MCRSGCPTPGQHQSWGECARAANLQVGPADTASRKSWDANLSKYRDARRQGLQPQMPNAKSAEAAMRVADITGTA